LRTRQASNRLVVELANPPNTAGNGPHVALDGDVLRHINLVSRSGNAGLLKDGGRLTWPPALQSDGYKAERERLNALAPEAVNQAVRGRVDDRVVQEMTRSVQRLRQK